MIRYSIFLFFISSLLYLSPVSAQNDIILQEGNNGYTGTSDISLITDTYGSNKYLTGFKIGSIHTLICAYFKC